MKYSEAIGVPKTDELRVRGILQAKYLRYARFPRAPYRLAQQICGDTGAPLLGTHKNIRYVPLLTV
jgi:hypothetical protein